MSIAKGINMDEIGMRKVLAEIDRLREETYKISLETRKVAAETAKIERETRYYPVAIAVATVAALAAAIKLLIH
jgi:uncharacterized membrane protein YjjP (DUF1212 family)